MKISGYAALFGMMDGVNDIIVRGAFKETMAQRDRPFPLHWQHKMDCQIGNVTYAQEDEAGLWIEAEITDGSSKRARQIKDGSIDGLSFGYRALRFSRHPRGRLLLQIDLFEVSVVTNPLQNGSRLQLGT